MPRPPTPFGPQHRQPVEQHRPDPGAELLSVHDTGLFGLGLAASVVTAVGTLASYVTIGLASFLRSPAPAAFNLTHYTVGLWAVAGAVYSVRLLRFRFGRLWAYSFVWAATSVGNSVVWYRTRPAWLDRVVLPTMLLAAVAVITFLVNHVETRRPN